MLDRFIDTFLPDSNAATAKLNGTSRKEQRRLVAGNLAIMATISLFAVILLGQGFILNSMIDAISAFLLLLNLIWYQKTGNHQRFAFFSLLIPSFVVGIQHGFCPPKAGFNLIWLPIITGTSAIILKKRNAYIMSAFTVGIFIVAEMNRSFFHLYELKITDTDITGNTILLCVVAALLVVFMARVVVVEQNRVEDLLEVTSNTSGDITGSTFTLCFNSAVDRLDENRGNLQIA